MITLSKLGRLEEGTRLRKYERLFHQMAVQSMTPSESFDRAYAGALAGALACDPSARIDDTLRTAARSLSVSCLAHQCDPVVLGHRCADLSLMLVNLLGLDQADWDLTERSNGSLDASQRTLFPITVVADRLRSPFNLGSLFRTADSFGVSEILVVQPSADPRHQRAQRSARGCTETVSWRALDSDAVLALLIERPVFALETGGTPLQDFRFPHEGVVIVGSEELGTSPQLLRLSDASLGRVSIPLAGTKGSLNVSVAFGILMQAWFSSLSHVVR
jgi:TrmH family RNA methyltransferase